MRRGIWLALVLTAASGCRGDLTGMETSEAGSDSSTGETASVTGSASSSTTASTTTDTAGGCDPGFACLADPPLDWNGPVVLATAPGDTPPACPNEWPDEAFVAYDDPVAPPAECSECTCAAPQGVECGPVEVELHPGGMCNSNTPFTFDTLGHAECVSFPPQPDIRGLSKDPSAAVNGTGSCAPTGGTATLEDWNWDRVVRGCSGAGAQATCDVGSCFPAETGACVFRTGEHECPPGYPVPTSYFLAVDDSRGCTACVCGSPAGASCDTRVDVFSADDCNSGSYSSIEDGTPCQALEFPFTAQAARLIVLGQSGGQCAPQAAAPSGGVTPTDPVTTCCTQ